MIALFARLPFGATALALLMCLSSFPPAASAATPTPARPPEGLLVTCVPLRSSVGAGAPIQFTIEVENRTSTPVRFLLHAAELTVTGAAGLESTRPAPDEGLAPTRQAPITLEPEGRWVSSICLQPAGTPLAVGRHAIAYDLGLVSWQGPTPAPGDAIQPGRSFRCSGTVEIGVHAAGPGELERILGEAEAELASPDRQRRSGAINAIAAARGPEAVGFQTRLLKTPGAEIAALRALRAGAAADRAEAIQSLLQVPDAHIVGEALVTLAALKVPIPDSAFEQVVRSPVPAVRHAAVEFFKQNPQQVRLHRRWIEALAVDPVPEVAEGGAALRRAIEP